MLREELAEAGHDMDPLTATAFSLGPCALVPLSMRFPDFSADGFLTSLPPPPLPHTHLDKWGVYTYLYKILEPRVRVWLVPNEEWTECKIWT